MDECNTANVAGYTAVIDGMCIKTPNMDGDDTHSLWLDGSTVYLYSSYDCSGYPHGTIYFSDTCDWTDKYGYMAYGGEGPDGMAVHKQQRQSKVVQQKKHAKKNGAVAEFAAATGVSGTAAILDSLFSVVPEMKDVLAGMKVARAAAAAAKANAHSNKKESTAAEEGGQQ